LEPTRPGRRPANQAALHSEGPSYRREADTRWASSRIRAGRDCSVRNMLITSSALHFCGPQRALKNHPDRLVGTFGDEDRVAGFDVDGLPRLVQIQAEGFLHNESFPNEGSVQ